MIPSTIEFAACTIIAKNYLPMARVLADSWRKFHPDCPFFVLLLDSPRGFFGPASEDFYTIDVSQLPIANLAGFLFKYTVLEASTAVKPYLLDYLLRRYSISKLLYLDPDILVLNSLDGLQKSLGEANVLLTPHLLSPLPADGRRQDDHDILQAGTYNLGFLGLRNSLESRRLLRWWSDKLYHHCLVSIENNLFVDQRWMDMVPALFAGVRILREPGYNVAYWNLHERAVACTDPLTVNGEPLHFFHFSGFDPDKLWVVSKYQDRYTQDDTGDARKLYSKYRDLLLEKDWVGTRDWKYGNDFFHNGVKIPASARRYYWNLGPDVAHLGNPFQWLSSDTDAPTIERFDSCQIGNLVPGVNLMGYFEAETGVGEGARSNWRIIQAAGVPYAVNNCVDTLSRNMERPPEDPTEANPFLANLVTVNADQFVNFAKGHTSYLRSHYNIGYWAWELPEFPEEWAPSFGCVDEIWTPSQFVRSAVASQSPVPVRVVPHSLERRMEVSATVDRTKSGLNPGTFVFLFMFDYYSYLERKNPLGLIKAFKHAFAGRQDVELVVKSAHGDAHKEQVDMVRKACAGANVRFLDRVLTRAATQELMMSADCYVSLHRSEGFGLTMAEAMMCGKPVIATGYSGNLDFMADADSFLVPFRTVAIDRTHGPYKAGYHWADPDLDYACDLMRHVESNREAAAQVGEKARTKVCRILDPAVIGVSVRARLEQLGLLGHAVGAESSTVGRG
ncbi:MAG: glycosyltransferase [Candidatus Korobacteraceae bacterium]|jgi:glycosyltransferase involved in cell wall biosynthesis